MQTDVQQQSGIPKRKGIQGEFRRFPSTAKLLTRLVRRAIDSFKVAPAQQSPLRLEALEPRILLAADPMARASTRVSMSPAKRITTVSR